MQLDYITTIQFLFYFQLVSFDFRKELNINARPQNLKYINLSDRYVLSVCVSMSSYNLLKVASATQLFFDIIFFYLKKNYASFS